MLKCPPKLALNFTALVASGLVAASGYSSALAQTVTTLPESGSALQAATALRARIAPPHDETIAAYVAAGSKAARVHALTEREWALVDSALADLPLLHRQILEQRLARLSFIDAPSSAGTALTRSFAGPDGELRFDITLRADVLEISLTDFLTEKEAVLFVPDGSGYSVRVTAGKASALTYILLHEATHVVDRTIGVTAGGGPFRAVWTDYRGLAEPYAAGPIGKSVYRRAPKLPLSQSLALYRALADAPFVSLYSTASAGEDFAELTAWNHLARRFGEPLKIEVRDAEGRSLVTVEPLKSPGVRARLDAVGALLDRTSASAVRSPK